MKQLLLLLPILFLDCQDIKHPNFASTQTESPSFQNRTDSVRWLIFDSISHKLFEKWEGTPWSFFGQTKVAKEGSIACGYFVTTLLTEAGFKIPANRWAQVASETFIREFTSEVYAFRNQSASDVLKSLEEKDTTGLNFRLYIAGLDNHVGFLIYEDNKWWFMHSNYYDHKGVEKVEAAEQKAFNSSNYRFIGRLLSDRMISKWERKEKWN